MKKIIACGLMTILMVVMVGCGKGKTTTVCTISQEGGGIKTEDTLTLEADGDTLTKMTSELNDTIEDPSEYQEEIDAFIEDYKAYEACPGGVDGENCNKFVKFTWSWENNVLKSKEITEVKKAVDAGKDLPSAGQKLGDEEYYSLKETLKSVKDEGYKCKEK